MKWEEQDLTKFYATQRTAHVRKVYHQQSGNILSIHEAMMIMM
jgi:hypothetical protein